MTSSTTRIFPPRIPETATKSWYRKLLDMINENFCKNVSSRSTGSFCRFCWNDSACTSFPPITKQMFSQSLSFHTLCSCFEFVSTTNNICNFRDSSFKQVRNNAFCSPDDLFTQMAFAVLPITFASAPNPHPRSRPVAL